MKKSAAGCLSTYLCNDANGNLDPHNYIFMVKESREVLIHEYMHALTTSIELNGNKIDTLIGLETSSSEIVNNDIFYKESKNEMLNESINQKMTLDFIEFLPEIIKQKHGIKNENYCGYKQVMIYGVTSILEKFIGKEELRNIMLYNDFGKLKDRFGEDGIDSLSYSAEEISKINKYISDGSREIELINNSYNKIKDYINQCTMKEK